MAVAGRDEGAGQGRTRAAAIQRSGAEPGSSPAAAGRPPAATPLRLPLRHRLPPPPAPPGLPAPGGWEAVPGHLLPGPPPPAAPRRRRRGRHGDREGGREGDRARLAPPGRCVPPRGWASRPCPANASGRPSAEGCRRRRLAVEVKLDILTDPPPISLFTDPRHHRHQFRFKLLSSVECFTRFCSRSPPVCGSQAPASRLGARGSRGPAAPLPWLLAG